MAIAKLFLHIVGVIVQYYGSTPPNVRPPNEQLHEQHGAERALPWFMASHKVVMWTWALLEGVLLFALSEYCPPALARPLLHTLPTTTRASLTTLTPAFLTGTSLALAGALLRAHCYRALGQRFTFELAIRPGHALVTHGAYSVVRHPSYVGVLAIAVGWLLCVLDPRGVVMSVFAGAMASGFSFGPGSALGAEGVVMARAVWTCVWATALSILAIGLKARMDKEDEMLEKNFGEEWRAWRERVPCRLVPGVC